MKHFEKKKTNLGKVTSISVQEISNGISRPLLYKNTIRLKYREGVVEISVVPLTLQTATDTEYVQLAPAILQVTNDTNKHQHFITSVLLLDSNNFSSDQSSAEQQGMVR